MHLIRKLVTRTILAINDARITDPTWREVAAGTISISSPFCLCINEWAICDRRFSRCSPGSGDAASLYTGRLPQKADKRADSSTDSFSLSMGPYCIENVSWFSNSKPGQADRSFLTAAHCKCIRNRELAC